MRAPRSWRRARTARSSADAGSAGPARPWRVPYRGALASRRGVLQRSFDAPERGCERRRSAPRTRGSPETLRGREQRAGLVVQLVRRITRVVNHCRQAGTPARRRQWGRSCSLRVDVRVTPHGMRGTTHANHGCLRRTLGAWGYLAHIRARAERVGERTHDVTAQASSGRLRSTALKR